MPPTETLQKNEIEALTSTIIGAAIEVHRALGPGLLESTYETCLALELMQRRLKVEIQKVLPLVYKGASIECCYRLDMIVEEKVIIEIKSVAETLPIHEAQLLSYLKISGCKAGLLINFNVTMLKSGIRRMSI